MTDTAAFVTQFELAAKRADHAARAIKIKAELDTFMNLGLVTDQRLLKIRSLTEGFLNELNHIIEVDAQIADLMGANE